MKPSVHLEHVASGRRWIGRCTGDPQPGNFIFLGCGDFWIGRESGSQIHLQAHSVSRRHAILRMIDTRLYLGDQFSRNGTRVNNGPRWGWGDRPRPVDPLIGWTEVYPSDRLTFGEDAVRILWVGEGSSPFKPGHLAWNGGTVVRIANTIREDASFHNLPVLADALEEAGCTDAVALACFRGAEKLAAAEYLLEHILGSTRSATPVNSRPMAKCPLPRHQPDPIAVCHSVF